MIRINRVEEIVVHIRRRQRCSRTWLQAEPDEVKIDLGRQRHVRRARHTEHWDIRHSMLQLIAEQHYIEIKYNVMLFCISVLSKPFSFKINIV